MAIISKLTTKKKDFKPKEYKDFIEELTKNKVTVGIHKGSAENVLNHALWNEFGTTHITGKTYHFRKKIGNHFEHFFIPKGTDISIPARPFVRLTLFPQVRKKINSWYGELLSKRMLRGLKTPKSNAREVLKDLSYYSELRMKDIANGVEFNNYAPNAALTVQIKGFNQPLLQTGKMINSIKGKVSKR